MKERDDFLLMKKYAEKLNDLIFKVKQDVLSFLHGEISKDHFLKVKKAELERELKEVKSLYKEINDKKLYRLFDELILEKLLDDLKNRNFKEKEEFKVTNFSLKPLESTLEKILRYSFSKRGEEGIALSDIIRTRFIVLDESYEQMKSLFLSSIYSTIKENENISLVYHKPFKVFIEGIEAELNGYVFENIFKIGNIYSYFLQFSSREETNEAFRVIKSKLKRTTKKYDKRKIKLAPLYKIDIEKCYEEIFKGLNIYLDKKENKISMLILEDSIIHNPNIKEIVYEINNEEFKNYLGILRPQLIGKTFGSYDYFAVRPHTAFEKIEVPYLFKELGINPLKTWYQDSILDEKDLTDNYFKDIPNKLASFSNINFAIGELSCEKTRFYPIGEIQIQTYSVKRLDQYNPNFDHRSYELERLKKYFLEPLNSLVVNYSTSKRKMKKTKSIMEYLKPLLEESVYKKYYSDSKGNKKRLSFKLNKDRLSLVLTDYS